MPIIAMVLDSYNIYNAVNFVTNNLKNKIESDNYPIVVLRPDSGNPEIVLPQLLDIMEHNHVGYTTNVKHYKVFKKYRFIWGDGINYQNIKNILTILKNRGYSSENMSFGSGSWLMQENSRDDLGFVYKCSAICVDDKWQSVFKSPVTDPTKTSKTGKQYNQYLKQVY